MRGVNIHRGQSINRGTQLHHWSSGILMSSSMMLFGVTPWTKLYSLNRSLATWQYMLIDERTRTITFPSIIEKMLDAKMVTASEAERLFTMGQSTNKEDQIILVMILKQIYKTKKHVHR
jgi:hypothetical protein